jgi:hypothetical protein
MSLEILNVDLNRAEIYSLLRSLEVDQKHWENLIEKGAAQLSGAMSNRKLRFRFGTLDRKSLSEIWEIYNESKQ